MEPCKMPPKLDTHDVIIAVNEGMRVNKRGVLAVVPREGGGERAFEFCNAALQLTSDGGYRGHVRL